MPPVLLSLANSYNVRIKLKHAIQKNTIYTCLSRFYHPKQKFSISKTKYHNYHFNINRKLYTEPISIEYSLKVDSDDPVITKICENQNLLIFIEEFIQLLKSKGVNISAGETPPMFQVARLATDYEIKEKLEALDNEFQKAGIQFDTETAQKFMLYATKEWKTHQNQLKVLNLQNHHHH
nr:8454_t:CDS:2 [Entrophospora candida]CAG8476349.1 7594_t:CDS:2 [Entrophospora candida]